MINNPQKKEAHIKSVIYEASLPLSTFPDLPIRYEMVNTATLKIGTSTTIMSCPH
jgi:hypothetical protein